MRMGEKKINIKRHVIILVIIALIAIIAGSLLNAIGIFVLGAMLIFTIDIVFLIICYLKSGD